MLGAYGGVGRDSWRGRLSTWQVWQEKEKTRRTPGSMVFLGLAEELQTVSDSVDASTISLYKWSHISCQPESPEAYGQLVVQTCQGSQIARILVVLFLPVLRRNLGVWGCGRFVIACDNYERNWSMSHSFGES